MAVSYPLAAAAFWEALRFAGRPEFVLQHYRRQSQDGGGNTFSSALGAPKWSVAVALEGGRHNRNQTQEADLKHLQGRDGTLLAYDIRRPYPESDPDGGILANGSALAIGAVAASGNTSTGAYAVEGASAALTDAVTVSSAAGTYFDVAGVLQTSAANALRVDYDPVTHAVRGILAEAAFTNLLTRSEAFDDAAWTKTRVTVTANATTAPDGATTMDKVVEQTDVSTNRRISQNFTPTNATAYTFSIFAKAAERSHVNLRFEGSFPAGNVTFDLTTGVATTGGSVTATSQNCGGGVWRLSITATSNGTSTTGASAFISNGTTITYDGVAGNGVYMWGAQLETGSALHTYLPTTSATVARAADALTFKAAGRNDWTVTFDNDATQAFNDDPGDFTPTASALTRPRIKAWSAIRDQQIATTVQVKSKGSNNRSLALKGLPPFYVITKGDKLSILYSSTKRFLFEAMETVTSNIAGDTAEFEISPHMPTGIAVNDVVTLVKACGKFKVVAGSYRPSSGRGNLSDGIGFSMISVP